MMPSRAVENVTPSIPISSSERDIHPRKCYEGRTELCSLQAVSTATARAVANVSSFSLLSSVRL